MLSINERLGNDYAWLTAFFFTQQRDTRLDQEKRPHITLQIAWRTVSRLHTSESCIKVVWEHRAHLKVLTDCS